MRSQRVLIIGLVAVAVVVGLALIVQAIGRASDRPAQKSVDALARSTNDCVVCHRETTPGIVAQYAYGTMAAAGVSCQECHEVPADYPGAIGHEGTHVLDAPTPARCGACHAEEVKDFSASRHALPAYVGYAGSQDLSPDLLAAFEAIPEGGFAPDKSRNALYQLEGPDITSFACEACHNIGRPRLDGSVGECEDCHLRHSFSLEQARKPETCNACHIGPDHPQWEIYQESPHGIAYMTGGHDWNWEADPGTLTVTDLPAATCATCHVSGFGSSATTHDVGERLTWYLFAPVSERRPDWEANKARMQGVCRACHNKGFVETFYARADRATQAVNAWVMESNEIVEPLKEQGLMTEAPFDQPIDFVTFNLWHHWGRTTKFGAWMQGPDYVQWHGAYEVLHELVELRHMADEMMAPAGTE